MYSKFVKALKMHQDELSSELATNQHVRVNFLKLYMPFGIPIFAPAYDSPSYSLLRDCRASLMRVLAFDPDIINIHSGFFSGYLTQEKLGRCLRHVNNLQTRFEKNYGYISKTLDGPDGRTTDIVIRVEDVVMARGVLQALRDFCGTVSMILIYTTNLLAAIPSDILSLFPAAAPNDKAWFDFEVDILIKSGHTQKRAFDLQDTVFNLMAVMDPDITNRIFQTYKPLLLNPPYETIGCDPLAVHQAFMHFVATRV